MPEYQAVVCSEGETKEMELYVGPFPEARLLPRDGKHNGDNGGNGNGNSDGNSDGIGAGHEKGNDNDNGAGVIDPCSVVVCLVLSSVCMKASPPQAPLEVIGPSPARQSWIRERGQAGTFLPERYWRTAEGLLEPSRSMERGCSVSKIREVIR